MGRVGRVLGPLRRPPVVATHDGGSGVTPVPVSGRDRFRFCPRLSTSRTTVNGSPLELPSKFKGEQGSSLTKLCLVKLPYTYGDTFPVKVCKDHHVMSRLQLL